MGPSAFGHHGMQIFNPAQLVGRFNEHLRDCVLLFGDEAFYAGDKQHESVLKGLIAEPFLQMEGKYERVVIVAKMLHIILWSNHDWVIPAGVDGEKASVRTSMLSRSVYRFSSRAPPVTPLITRCKPVTMADN